MKYSQEQQAKINSLIEKVNVGSTALGKKTGREFTQLTPLGVQSSNSVLDDKQKGEATTQAGNALVTTSEETGYDYSNNYQGGQNNQGNQYMGSLYNTQNTQNEAYQDQFQALELMFDSSLARSNQKYGSLQQELQQNYQKATQIADVNAAALNPYSQAQGAATADNFKGKITENYQRQAQSLQRQAEAAESELRAGNHQAFVAISNNMKTSNAQFQQNMQKFLLDQQASTRAQQNSDRNYQLQADQFGFKQGEVANDNFMNFVNDFGMDENFRGEISNYFETGEITAGLMPLIEKGMAAGLSPDEALSIAQYDTLNQTKERNNQAYRDNQTSLGWYNANTSRINANKVSGGGGYQPSDNGYLNTDKDVNTALTQALATKGLANHMKDNVREVFDTQGMQGGLIWAANNKLSAGEKENYNQYANGSAILRNVSSHLDQATYQSGPYKALGEKAKPWVAIKHDVKYANLRQNIEFAQAQIRKGFYGTAVTDSEAVNANKFLINDNDTLPVIKMKAENLAGLLQFANDRNAAATLGVGHTIKIENYISEIGTVGQDVDPAIQDMRNQYGY